MSISIHALLAESDFTLLGTPDTWTISIHALLAESDPRSPKISILPCQFLSTLSLRRATWPLYESNGALHISIHALLAESDVGIPNTNTSKKISIHALLAESDYCHLKAPPIPKNFYPRSPCGERRLDVTIIGRTWDISIHALLAESDTSRLHKILADWDFYPRSPCGERRNIG